MSNIRHLFVSLLLLLLLLGFAQSVAAEDKFAIAADGDQAVAEVANLAGIAPFFHLYDVNGKLLEVVPNPHLDMEYGIGPAAAASLADMGVTVLVARRIPGPKMDAVLTERGVRIVRRIGTVQDVANELSE
jgi:predicted Fe-Mo cluster-binding NifX family protein